MGVRGTLRAFACGFCFVDIWDTNLAFLFLIISARRIAYIDALAVVFITTLSLKDRQTAYSLGAILLLLFVFALLGFGIFQRL